MSLAASRGEPRRVALLRPLRVVRMCLASDSPMKTTTSNKLGITLAAVLALIILPVRVDASPPQYTVTVLGGLGGTSSQAYGINASGQVAGQSYLTGDGSYHAVRWTGTTPTDLGTLGGSLSASFGINDSGQAAGWAYTAGGGGNNHTVRWTGTTPTDLGTLGGSISTGLAINASGQVTGNSQTTGNSARHAVRWTGTTPTDLGTLGGIYSAGLGINTSGQIAGWAYTAGGVSHAVRWTGTSKTDLGTLGGNASEGHSINDAGQVAGSAQKISNKKHAVRWTGTTPTDLGTLGGTESEGYGINAFGDVTGMSWTTGDATFNAFLYTDGTMYDLNALLLPGSGVTGLVLGFYGNSINDFGQIAATGTINGQARALRLDPVAAPEPSSAMLVIGSGLVFVLRRRRV